MFWFNVLDVNIILVVNDGVVVDDFCKLVICFVKFEVVKLVMKSIDESIEVINFGVIDKYNMFIVVELVEDVYKLIYGMNGKILMLNLGGIK